MRLRFLGVLSLFLIFTSFAIGARNPHHYARTLYVIDHSKVVSAKELKDDLPAFQKAVSEDFAPYWGMDVKLVIADKAPAGAWRMVLEDESPFWNALGYHTEENGAAVGYVYAASTKAYDLSWSVTFTHELFELLADPFIDRAALVGNTFYLVEVCDPVEGDQFAYTRRSDSGKPVKISDFLLPRWYLPFAQSGPFDFAKHNTLPLQLLPDGYVATWDGIEWVATFWPNVVR